MDTKTARSLGVGFLQERLSVRCPASLVASVSWLCCPAAQCSLVCASTCPRARESGSCNRAQSRYLLVPGRLERHLSSVSISLRSRAWLGRLGALPWTGQSCCGSRLHDVTLQFRGGGGGIRGRSEVSAGVCRPKQGRASRCGVALLQRERPPPTSTASSPSRLLVFFLPLSLPRLSPDPAHFWGPFPPQPLGT